MDLHIIHSTAIAKLRMRCKISHLETAFSKWPLVIIGANSAVIVPLLRKLVRPLVSQEIQTQIVYFLLGQK